MMRKVWAAAALALVVLLAPAAAWVQGLEGALQRSVIGNNSNLFVHADLSGLPRGNDLDRLQAAEIAVRIGAVDPDEIREQEGYSPRKTPRVAPPAAGAPPAVPAPAPQREAADG